MGLPQAGTTPAAAPVQLPCPGFEGFEKRLEVQFEPLAGFAGSALANSRGLRDIPRAELDVMLEAAACTIVSRLSNEHFDSYVLSESSLFVYSTAVVIKTCGTTRLLQAVPQLLASAAHVKYKPVHCRYTRGKFIFPEAQPAPYNDFNAEAELLNSYFGHLGHGGKAYVMGDAISGAQWHVYCADARNNTSAPTLTLEMCMTELDKKLARQFFEDSGLGDAKAVTAATGIKNLLPGSSIDDFSFTPCGYSMNGIEDKMHSTIHVTPEDGHSYASFEARGYTHDTADLASLVKKVLAVFKPGKVSIAIHADGPARKGDFGSWWSSVEIPGGYLCSTSSQQQMVGGACTVFHTLKTPAGVYAEAVVPLALGGVVAKVQPEQEGVVVEEAAAVKVAPLLSKANVPAHAWDWDDEEGVYSDQEVTEHVLEALKRKGAGVADAVTSLRPVLLASGDRELDGLCAEIVAARNAAADEGGEAEMSSAERAFYVMDLGEVVRLWDLWVSSMPRVHAFYAVKCNPDKALLRLLAALGSGFDVASLAELEAVKDVMGGAVPADRIIFANPCKFPTHIAAAASIGVHLSTFDSESELLKLKKADRNARAVLRIRVDDPSARCPLGVKYGAELGECRRLLYAARRLGVSVEGVAFHVGSGAGDSGVFALGVRAARDIFTMAKEIGFNMNVLDVGGGFTADGGAAGGASFRESAAAISAALDECFPAAAFPGLKIIAEPGRFFAETPFTLATHVFGTRARGRGSKRRYEYWIDDGIYGSMNSLLYDHAVLSVRPLRVASAVGSPRMGYSGRGKQNKEFSSTVFGPTCDGLDTVLRDVSLPKLECGDWLMFPRMGAYTKAAGSSFNGFAVADITVAAYVLTSAHARPFYTAASKKGSPSLSFRDSKAWEVEVGEVEWGILEGGASSEDEEDKAWMAEGFSSGSDSDE